jgi:hypothetical protein
MYRYAGARGITVCPEWWSYKDFESWALCNGYRPGFFIFRRDLTGPFSPDNCIFAPKGELGRYKTTTRHIAAFGETKLIKDWATDPRCVVSFETLRSRLRLNWPPELAITAPLRALWSAEVVATP